MGPQLAQSGTLTCFPGYCFQRNKEICAQKSIHCILHTAPFFNVHHKTLETEVEVKDRLIFLRIYGDVGEGDDGGLQCDGGRLMM